MTVARARRYPTPPPVAEVLGAERCDHGAVTGRCPLCRVAAEHAADRNIVVKEAVVETGPTATTSRGEA